MRCNKLGTCNRYMINFGDGVASAPMQIPWLVLCCQQDFFKKARIDSNEMPLGRLERTNPPVRSNVSI